MPRAAPRIGSRHFAGIELAAISKYPMGRCPQTSLTHFDIQHADPESKPCKRAGGVGLFLVIQPNGGKPWRPKYRWLGTERSPSFAPCLAVSLAVARTKRDDAKKLTVAVDAWPARRFGDAGRRDWAANAWTTDSRRVRQGNSSIPQTFRSVFHIGDISTMDLRRARFHRRVFDASREIQRWPRFESKRWRVLRDCPGRCGRGALRARYDC